MCLYQFIDLQQYYSLPLAGAPAFGFPTSVGAKAPNAGVKG
jgi:hypothetical protein